MEHSSKLESEKSVLESIQLYAQKKHQHDVEAVLLSRDSSQHHVIPVHAMSLLEYSIDFAHSLFNRPNVALKLLESGFRKTAQNIYQVHDLKSKMTTKENLHVRLTALPSCPEIYRTVLPKCSDIGQFLCITGTVIRATLPKMLEFRKQWRCTKCKYYFTMDVEVETDFAHTKPSVCTNPDPCSNKNFASSSGVTANWCRDYQEVKVQEQIQNLVIGTVPRSMWVILENDLVDSCQPGSDVIISGVIHTRWQRLVKGCRSEIELVLVAHNVEIKNNNIALGTVSEDSLKEFELFWLQHQNTPLHGRDFILSSLCPQVFGLYIVKLAVALVLAGGVQRIDNDSVIRGDSHLLLVGDPGTGKSQFLKYSSKISRRSVLTSGIGTTNAGLTAAAMKDGGKWQLEAGALVLADGGICCIDEFNSIKEHDKASIHEAMEQQTISVAKAGLVCKLSTQCSILATTNPKGKYNKQENLSINTAMASPLLSRFDVILVLLDTYDAEWDSLVSSYILEGKDMPMEQGINASWSMGKMRAYFSAIRNIKPKLTNDCDRVLQAYYQKHRSCEGRSAARTTPRLLQSLIRLAQGHARLMFRMDVLVVDAIVAVMIMESSMVGFALFEDIDALHSKFSDDPNLHYEKQAKRVLEVLELHDLLEKEQISAPVENRNQDLREIILTQMDPFFHLQPFNEKVHQNEDELIRKALSLSGSPKEQDLRSSQNPDFSNSLKNKRQKALVENESEDSSDTVPVLDPFAEESDEFPEALFEEEVEDVGENSRSPIASSDQTGRMISFSPHIISTQRNSVSSSKYFLNGANSTEIPETDRRPPKQSTINDLLELPLAKKSRSMASAPLDMPHTNALMDAHTNTVMEVEAIIPSQRNNIGIGNEISDAALSKENEGTFGNYKVPSRQNLRKRNMLDVENLQENVNFLTNDVSTLSELNAMFSADVLRRSSSGHSTSPPNSCSTRENNLGLLDSFAFKPKTTLSPSDNIATSNTVNAKDSEPNHTQSNRTVRITSSQSLWTSLSLSKDNDVLDFDI